MENKPAHSEIRKYDIVFIGGGPATLAFLCYLFQRKLADKLFSSANILIIEKGDNFGAGCLGKYGINTNTSSEGFVRLICNAKEKKGKKGKVALSPSRKPMKVSKNYNKQGVKRKPVDGNKFVPIPVFDNLYKSSSVQTLLNIGNRPAPLTLVGYYLDTLGNYLVDYINTLSGKNILMTRKEVKAVKIYNNEEFGVLIKDEEKNIETTVKARCVVMASGGRQAVRSQLYSDIVKHKGESNVYLSDYVLQKPGYANMYENIVPNMKKKIVIIGGSHSAFSCAWIILNSPSSYHNIKIGEDLAPKTDGVCQDDCKCFGSVGDRNWHLSGRSISEQVNVEIKMLYRDHIRVFYASEQDAVNDGYTCYDKRQALSKHGKVYPFIGIRGDAKELYKRINRGEEKRVELVKTWDDHLDYVKEADIVIWACGYNTNNIAVKDFRSHTVDLFTDDSGMIEVDKQLRIMNSKKVPIPNLYGIGQGYSTKAPEIINGKKARADSIHLYNSHISAKLYKSIEGLLSQISVDNLNRYRRYETSTNVGKRTVQDWDIKKDRDYNNTKNLLLAKVNKTEKYFSEKNKSGSPGLRLLPQLEKKINMINYCRIIQNNILKKNC
jgi:hypothetical protein